MRRLVVRRVDGLLGTDGRQRVRVLHHLISFGVMVVGVAGMLWLVQAGLAPTGPVAAWAALSLGGYAAIYAALRSGYSRRYRDPSLTLVQIVYCIVSCAVAYALSGPARGGVFPLLMIAVMFGMFRLPPRTVWRLGVFAVLLLSAVGLVMVCIEPARYPPLSPNKTDVIGVELAPRSVYRLQDEIRWAWQPGLFNADNKQLSLRWLERC